MTNKICFVISPIGEPDSETRKRSDQILKHVITPAIRTHGYNAVRADQISEPGIITSQVIQHIVDDPLVIADLTDHNPNVFYELAVRHAIRKALIQLMNKDEQLPFDIINMRTILIDHKDLDSVEEAKKEIIKQIEASEKEGSIVETPISVAIELQRLRKSDDPLQKSLADLFTAVTEIRTTLGIIDKKLSPSIGENAFEKFIRDRSSRTGLSNMMDSNIDNRSALASILAAMQLSDQLNKNFSTILTKGRSDSENIKKKKTDKDGHKK